jgi:hypothetical protein
MKRSILFLIAACILCCLPPGALAAERNFAAGSLIIPMGSFYQPSADNGILEAYGLAFNLLENGVTVYWIINEAKTTIGGTDFVIEDLTLVSPQTVAKKYNHAGGTVALTFKTGDSYQRISYSGGPWVIDASEAAAAKAIIDDTKWAAVDVHEAQVPFKAPVYREMNGTPPKIALMNNSESDTGNVAILESYLRLAGICPPAYTVLSPNDIRDGALTNGVEEFDFLWAPHWTGYDSYDKDADGDGILDVENIVSQVATFLRSGKGLFAECASIEVFEHSPNGHFLTTNDLGHNGGTNNASTIIYNDMGSANSQIGDFPFVPQGGHLHNWRPFQANDPHDFSPKPVVPPNSAYRPTVTRFTIDNTGWDYYVGGYAFGDTDYGYVVYLGGHKYASCSSTYQTDPDAYARQLKFELTKDGKNQVFMLTINYNSGLSTTVTFSKASHTTITGDPLEIDVTTATTISNQITYITLRNKSSSVLTVNSIILSWTGDPADQKLKKITELTDDMVLFTNTGVASGYTVTVTGLTVPVDRGEQFAGCTENSDCTAANIAAVRYILNTLFNIKFQIHDVEYVRSTPVVAHPWLYQGSFAYPSYQGHFRRYNVENTAATADWDTGDSVNKKIKDALTGNGDGNARQVFTAKNTSGQWTKINFDAANINELRTDLNVTPANGDDTDEIRVINRLRGKPWTYNRLTKTWAFNELSNKLGGIMHSAPAIVSANGRTGSSREEIAYVGDVYGILHAVATADGTEKWGLIPRNLLGRLKNDRTDPNAVQDFAAVDASPTVRDIYYDHDNDDSTAPQWRTILVCSEGPGGTYLFALDVTDPANWSVLWEATDTAAPGGGMGHAYRTSLSKVKWPVKDGSGNIVGYEAKWVVFVATGYLQIAENHGGIHVFAFDLVTGSQLWRFTSPYADSVNDIPGAVSTFDLDSDGMVERLYVGDMDGRLWELNAVDGTNPNGTDGDGNQIPLYNCGGGNPISVSSAITRTGTNHVVVIFGTGGTDWASDGQAYAVYAVDATQKRGTPTYAEGAGTLLWQKTLGVGEKVWSSPTIAAGQVYVATAYGQMEPSNPVAAVPVLGANSGNLYSLKVKDGSQTWSLTNVGKARGNLFVSKEHVYLTTVNNTVIQVGNNSFTAGGANNVVVRDWRQM